ncbi:MAG: HNH endonuclease [Thermincolia bacterium]
MEKVCIVCGAIFHSLRTQQKTCGFKCRQLYNSKRTFKTCIICSKKMWVNSKSTVCSSVCKKIHQKNKRIIKHLSITRQCEWCDKKFNSSGIRRFCSKKCRTEHKLVNRQKAVIKTFKRDNTVIADISQKTEQIRLKFGNKTISTWLTSGFNNGLKKAILERDGHMCYICGKTTSLHVHHIIPRKEGGPHIPENLVTLCSGCHKTIESGCVEKAVKKCVQRTLQNII